MEQEGFYTQQLAQAINHTTSRAELQGGLEGQMSFNDPKLLESVFKVNEVPDTWIEAAKNGYI